MAAFAAPPTLPRRPTLPLNPGAHRPRSRAPATPLTATARPPRPPAAAAASPSAAAAGRAVPAGAAGDVSYAPGAAPATGRWRAVPDGTLLLQVPSLAPHLAACGPLSHARDGDGYLVAVSVARGEVWVRARFVRTKPYMREAREGRRVYRGRYGTPGSKGLAAPVRAKRACGDGVFVWGRRRRAVAYGEGGLPVAVEVDTLVSRKVTALGACLTDAPELAGLRGAEVSAAPVRVGGREGEKLVICARTRATAGRVTGVVFYEVDAGYKVVYGSNRLAFPGSGIVFGFAVVDGWYVVLYGKAGGGGGGGGVLGAIFGGGSGGGVGAVLERAAGTRVMLVPAEGADRRSRRRVVDVELSGAAFVTGVAGAIVEEGGGGVVLDVAAVDVGEVRTLGDLADAQDGRAGAARVRLRRFCVRPDGAEEVAWGAGEIPGGSTSFHRPAAVVASPVRYEWEERALLSAVTVGGWAGVAAVDRVSGHVVAMWRAGAVDEGVLVSAPVVLEGGLHAAVLVSGSSDELDSRVVVLETGNVAAGPVAEVVLAGSRLGACVGGVWCDAVVTWEEFGHKRPMSSYELFDDKRWNDVNNGFSSIGLNQ